jgi:hypothetical protein
VFTKSGSWSISILCGLWQSFIRKWIAVSRWRTVIHRDLRALRALRSGILPKRNLLHFCPECACTTAFFVHSLCSASHMLYRHFDKFFARKAKSKSVVFKLCAHSYVPQPILTQWVVVQSGAVWYTLNPCLNPFFSATSNKTPYIRTPSFRTSRSQNRTLQNFSKRLFLQKISWNIQ